MSSTQIHVVPRPVATDKSLLIVTLILAPLSCVLVLLKAIDRCVGRYSFRSEDLLLPVALIANLGFSVAACLSYYVYGGIRVIPVAPFPGLEQNALTNWIAGVTNHISLMLIKLTLVIFYRRVFNHFRFQIVANVLIALDLLFGLGYLLFYLLQCSPTNYYWTRFTPTGKGHCLDPDQALLSVGTVSVILDVLVLVLPLRIFQVLSYPLKQKILIMLLFMVGLIACIAGVLRIYYLLKAINDPTGDELSYTVKFWIALTVEAYLGICCACLPTLRTLITNRLNFRRLSKSRDPRASFAKMVSAESKSAVRVMLQPKAGDENGL